MGAVRGRRRWVRSGASGALLVLAVVAAACAPAPPTPVDDPGTSTELTQLRVADPGPSARIVDAHGRQVQLRGTNLNHLGDYFQPYPQLPTVLPVTDTDWDEVVARGYDAIRLVTSWSAWEPERDRYDDAYARRVRDTVRTANEHGLYVVIDMQQDAWSRFVSTPADEPCPAGTSPQKGWDGAPAWATLTDGRPTCSPGGREDSPAVRAAWDAFYADRDGIRSELAQLWGRIAAEYAHVPGVAGYDLLNEPGPGSDDGSATVAGLTGFFRDSLAAIRAAESSAGAPPHLVLFETMVYGTWVPRFTDDPDLVFAPHVYAEAIGPSFPGMLDLLFGALRVLGAGYGTPVWVGEYNQYGSEENQRSWMSRFARLSDANGYAGGTWYTWNYGCGDPHGLQWPATPEWLAQQVGTCPGSRSPVACDTRSYPRAAPGRVSSIEAAPCGGSLIVTGSTPATSTADLWFRPDPAPSGEDPGPPPAVTGDGVVDVEARPQGGGWRLFVRITGDYRIDVAPAS